MFEIQMITDGHSLIEEVSAEKAVELIDAYAEEQTLYRVEASEILRVTLTPENWADKFPVNMLTGDGRLAIVDSLNEDSLTEEDWELFYDYAVHFNSGPIEGLWGILEEAREHAIIPTRESGNWNTTEYRLADHYMEEFGYWEQIPENLRAYFDLESYGKDLMHEHVEGDYWVYWA